MINSYTEKLENILSLNRGGDNTKIDSAPEYLELSIFLKKNSEALSKEKYDNEISLKTHIENLLKQYSIYDKTGTKLADKGYGEEIYNQNTYEISNNKYTMHIEVRPNSDNSDYVILLDFYNSNGEKITTNWTKYFNSFMNLNSPAPNGEEELYLLCIELNENYGISSFKELSQFINYNLNSNSISFTPKNKISGKVVEAKEVSSSEGIARSEYASNVGSEQGKKTESIKPFTNVTEENFLYSSIFAILLNSLNEAEESFQNQLDESSYFTALSEAVRNIVGYGENLDDVTSSIQELRSVLNILRDDLETNKLAKFEKDFRENFGTEINPEAIIRYAENAEPYAQKCAIFETKATLESVIKDLTSTINDSAPERDISETVFNKFYNNILQLMGCDNSDFLEDLDYIASERAKMIQGNDLVQEGFDNRSNKEKIACLRDYARIKLSECEEIINTSLNGQTLEDVKKENHNLYAAAFGNKFDALNTVERYCELQQIGTTLAKGVTLLLCSIAMTASAGSAGLLLAPFIMYGTDATINIIDESTKMKAINTFKNEGIEGYCDYIVKNVPWTTIHEDAMHNAILSLPFLGMNCAIMNICTKAGVPILATMGAQTVANAGLGSAIEYAATGEITIDGVIYIVTMDIIGHTVSLKNIKRKPKQPKVSKPKSEELPLTNVNEEAAKGFLSKIKETGIAHYVAKLGNCQILKFRTNMFNAGKATYILLDAEGNAISRPFTVSKKGLGAKLREAGIENDNNFNWEKTESAVYNPQNMAKAGMSAAALLTGIFGDVSAAGGVAMAAMPILSLSGKTWNLKMFLPKIQSSKLVKTLKANPTTTLETRPVNFKSAKPKTLEGVLNLIDHTCRKYGFNRMYIDPFVRGLDINLKIFDTEISLKNYLDNCIKYAAKGKKGIPLYNIRGYNKNNGAITQQVDVCYITELAILKETSPGMSRIVDILCYNTEKGNLDVFSFKKMIQYLQDGYISPETVEFTLINLMVNNKHVLPTNFIELDKPSPGLKKQRAKLLKSLKQIHPELKPAIKELESKIGEDIYGIKWEDVTGRTNNSTHIKRFIEDIPNLQHLKKIELNPEIFYIKLDGYGKDENWASQILDITESATNMQISGKNSDEVLAYIAAECRQLVLYGGGKGAGTASSYGILRCNRDGYIAHWLENINGSITPFDSGSKYSAYANRFRQHFSPNELHNPYPGKIELTRLVPDGEYPLDNGTYVVVDAMIHPNGNAVSGGLDIVKNLHSQIMNKYKGKDISPKELIEINETIGEIHWIMAHVMPWSRGSDAITNAFVKSIYQTLGIKTYAPREGLSFDLEAFCTELKDYKKLYSTYYEKSPEVVGKYKQNVEVKNKIPDTKPTEKPRQTREAEKKTTQPKTSQPKALQQAATGPRELAIEKFNKDSKTEYPPQEGTMDANTKYILDRENLPEITLYDGTPVDLSLWYSMINNLGDGEYLTIGREGDIMLDDVDMSISRHHLVIKNENGQLLIKDVSQSGRSLYRSRETISKSLKEEAFKKFNPDKPLSKIEKGKLIDKRYQYELKMYGDDKLPKLRLYNGTEIDLNLPENRFLIEYLGEGDYITIGRDGDIKINDNTSTISRHHLLIVKHNGVLILKDVSANGGTYVV